MFSWIDAVGDYENAHAKIESLLSRFDRDEDTDPCPDDDDFLNGLPEDAVLFAFTHHGMACGPVSTTIIHGIRFPLREFD